MLKTLALVCVLGSFTAHGFAQPPPNDLSAAHSHPHSCLVPSEGVRASIRNCATKLDIRPWELGKPDDNGYDDKCFFNCVWEERKLVNSDGDILDDVFKAHLIKLAETNGKSSDLVLEPGMKCVEAARAEFANSGGVKANKCKFAVKASHCLREEDAKLC